jgi:5-methylcytosine-specific restriction protein B
MSKLQLYFDYFDKYSLYDEGWYEILAHWVNIAQKIKSEVKKCHWVDIEETRRKIELEKIFSDCSEQVLKTIQDFCDQYLFKSNNGISTIHQQLLEHERRHEISNKVNTHPNILIDILIEDNVHEVEKQVRELLVDNTNSVIYRFLRVLFPASFTAPDAPNRLGMRLGIMNSKLGITIPGSNIIDQHQNLMNLIKDNDILKKQIFFWYLYDMLDSHLNLKKAMVYYGAPGTGKTFHALNIGKQFIDQHRIKIGRQIGEGDQEYLIEKVQFHPSYNYEDFMEGIRPSIEGKLSLFNGTFKEFCKKAGEKEIALYHDTEFFEKYTKKEVYDFSTIKVSELTEAQKKILDVQNELPEGITIAEVIEPAFFIIDEINRAELSRVFGELMFSLEYRGYIGKIKTQYSYLNKDKNSENTFFWVNNEDWFFIPQNVFLVGTMNNIDRSVDSFDFALRRRFIWEEIEPNFDLVRNLITASWKDELANAFEELNQKIFDEELLGKDYRIGHSYALDLRPIQHKFETLNDVKKFLWNDFIKPLLEEYLRGLGDSSKANSKLETLQKAFGV